VKHYTIESAASIATWHKIYKTVIGTKLCEELKARAVFPHGTIKEE